IGRRRSPGEGVRTGARRAGNTEGMLDELYLLVRGTTIRALDRAKGGIADHDLIRSRSKVSRLVLGKLGLAASEARRHLESVVHVHRIGHTDRDGLRDTWGVLGA